MICPLRQREKHSGDVKVVICLLEYPGTCPYFEQGICPVSSTRKDEKADKDPYSVKS